MALSVTTPRTEIVSEPFAKYQAFPALNFSALKLSDIHTNGCPAKALAELESKFATEDEAEEEDEAEDEKATDAMQFGSLYHSFLLEPKSFFESAEILDDAKQSELFRAALEQKSKAKGFSRKLSTYKTWSASVAESGKQIVDARTLEKMQRMIKAANETTAFSAIARDPESLKESSVYFGVQTSDGRYIQCKARCDLFGNGILVDVKTCRSAHSLEFAKTISKMGYDMQLAWYKIALEKNGVTVKQCAILPQEKQYPYLAAFYTLPSDWLAYATKEVKRIFRAFERCVISGKYPGYNSGEIAPPPYLDEAISNS